MSWSLVSLHDNVFQILEEDVEDLIVGGNDPPSLADTDPPSLADTDPPSLADTDPSSLANTDPRSLADTDPSSRADMDRLADPPYKKDTSTPVVPDVPTLSHRSTSSSPH